MLWYRDFQLEWVARGVKCTRDLRSKPISFDYLRETQAEANRRGRAVTCYELRPHRWNGRTLRRRLVRLRPTTNLRFMVATDPPKPRPSDAARRRAHRAAERAGQLALSIH